MGGSEKKQARIVHLFLLMLLWGHWMESIGRPLFSRTELHTSSVHLSYSVYPLPLLPHTFFCLYCISSTSILCPSHVSLSRCPFLSVYSSTLLSYIISASLCLNLNEHRTSFRPVCLWTQQKIVNIQKDRKHTQDMQLSCKVCQDMSGSLFFPHSFIHYAYR